MAADGGRRHRPQNAAAPTVLLAPADGVEQAGRVLAEGADVLDVSGCAAADVAAIEARYPDVPLWAGRAGRSLGTPGPPGPGALVDADLVAAGEAAGAGEAGDATDAGKPPVAAVVAVAAISTWLGAAAVRTTHVRAVRRAIDMAATIAGTRPPALTTRGLA
jgi:dihydropteroate synthase